MSEIKSIEKIKEIIESDFKCSEEIKKESIKQIKNILKRLESNILEVKDLNNKEFIIPDYQRAYRWGTDEIEKLIEDINEKDEKSYFLQPIIYRKDANGKDIIIDGQQRLTSIYIILRVLGEIDKTNTELPKYTIEYVTRNETTKYLKDFNDEEVKSNIDIFHMKIAKKAVENLIKNIDINKLEKNILNTKFIYHQIDQNDENKIFQRINTGKIPLTNGELVKAFILNKSKDNAQISERAVIWDNMEKELHIEDFWCMCNRDFSNYQDTRIDFILEITAKKIIKENKTIERHDDRKNKYWIFEILEEYYKLNNIDELWKKIRENYRILKKWYENREIYHLIGYIINNEDKIISLLEQYEESKNKKEFIKKLYDIIKKQNKKISVKTADIPEKIKKEHPEYKKYFNEKNVAINDKESLEFVCRNINYNMSKDSIRKILLLFNILTFLKNDESESKNFETNRFSFGQYKNGQWDIEHIHAKNDKTNDKNENLKLLREALNDDQKKKLKEIEENIRNKKSNEEKNNMENENIEAQIFNKFYEEELLNNEEEKNDKYTKEINDEYECGTLKNLTLLDSKTNREYQDNVFIIKRNILLEKDKKEIFIPICTRNAFLKYYSKNIKQIACWSEGDGNDYLNEIINTIKNSPIYEENEKDEQ